MLKKVIGVFLFSVVSGHAAAATLNLQNLVTDARSPNQGFKIVGNSRKRRMMGNSKDLLAITASAGRTTVADDLMDDRAASDDEVAEFRRQKREQKEREMSVTVVLNKSVRTLKSRCGCWKITPRLAHRVHPVGATRDVTMAQMQGTVSISKSGLCVEYLEISSRGQ